MFESYYIGLDLGQMRDFTAIAVVERAVLQGEYSPVYRTWRKEVELRLRHVERVPMGTPYPEVVERVAEVTRSPKLTGPIHLAADNTGVGAAVVDLLRDARPRGMLMPVTITGGDTENLSEGVHRVPQRDLIVGLQVLLQRGGLRIAAELKDGPALLAELMDMQVKVSTARHEQYGVWREGKHDDLVFAVALACWAVGKAYPKRKGRDEGWWTNPYEADMMRMFQKQMEASGR